MAKQRSKTAVMKHMGWTDEPEIVLWEQSKHRTHSRGNASSKGLGCTEGTPNTHWQSHHILCIGAFHPDYRKQKNEETNHLLDQCLFLTKWNINDAPNMIGLPQRALYRKNYGGLTKHGVANVSPTNLPAHNNDHTGPSGYLWEVRLRLKRNVWNKFKGSEPDHEKNTQWLDEQLRGESEDVLFLLLRRGRRMGGTVAGWRNRFDPAYKLTWFHPFSMGVCPKPRKPGINWSNMTNIFKELKL